MNPNLDFLTVGEQRVQKLLLTGDFFQGIDVLTNANGDLQEKIRQVLAEKKRCIALRIAQGTIPQPGTSEPWKLFIVVTEFPIINRVEPFDGKTARMIAQKIIARAARTGIDLTDATEVLADDGSITLQLVGTVAVAMPVGEPQSI